MVRIALLSLLFGAFALALVQPSQAGTATAPEISDPAGDVTSGPAPACASAVPACAGAPQFVDLTLGWVTEGTPGMITFWSDVSGNANANAYGDAQFDFHFTVGTTDYVAGFHVSMAGLPVVGLTGTGTVTPTGVATQAAYAEGAMSATVPMTAIGSPATGTKLTKLFVTSRLTAAEDSPVTFTDRAPNADFGQDYVIVGAGGAPVVPGDTDGDLLNDTCEQEFYGDLNGTNNATADDDGDGLTNGQECAGNPRTDPTKSDTDGDGVNDKDDPFPTDPTKGGAGGNSTSTNTGTGGTGTRTNTGTGTGTGSGSNTKSGTQDNADGEVKNLGDAVEKLQSDLDYLGLSGGGMVAVLILAILALAVRWSL